MTTRILVAGAIAARPHRGGHAAALLQWAMGFRDLGYDTWFVDRLPPGTTTDPAWLGHVMDTPGLRRRYVLLDGDECIGRTRRDLMAFAHDAVLFDINGFLADDDVLGSVSRRVYVDVDPGFPQLWHALGTHDAFSRHDAFVTVGANVGSPASIIPGCGRTWIATPPPVYLPWWPSTPRPATDLVTSVAMWRGPFAPVDYRGERYGLRVHEFRRFVDVAARVDARCELALDIDPVADATDVERLHAHGWHLVDPQVVAPDPFAYRAYLRRSVAELCVAKELYVKANTGWVSDRSACYLASGRPVVAQDTGWRTQYGGTEGLVAFADADEAVDALREVLADYERHAKAAVTLAHDCFASTVVLPALLDRLGLR